MAPEGARRFFEADEGIGLNVLIDNRGDAILGLIDSRQAVVDALAAWTGVASATISMANRGGQRRAPAAAGGQRRHADVRLRGLYSPFAALSRLPAHDPEARAVPADGTNGVFAKVYETPRPRCSPQSRPFRNQEAPWGCPGGSPGPI
jgi:hypothetical protein